MNELQKYQPKLPVSYQRHLAKGTDNMTSIARLTSHALAEEGHVYTYAVFEALKTLTTIEALKHAFPTSMDPETDAILKGLTQDYMLAMQKIPQEASKKILLALENASVTPEEEGLLQSITNAFIDWLNR